MSESSSAKIAVVVGIGAIVIGGLALRAKYAPHPPQPEVIKPTPTVVSAATAATAVPSPGDRTPEPPQPAAESRGPTADDRQALLDAINAADLGKVEVLVGKGVSLEGMLDDAAKSGSAPLVQYLLAHGVAATEGEELSVPPILLADDNDGIVNALLAKGAHEPPLAKAVQAGAPKAVARQVANAKGGGNASANAKTPEGDPLLLVAVRDTGGAKRRAIIDTLLKAGADPNAKSEDESPLSLAVSRAAHAAASGDGANDEKAGERPIDVVVRLIAAKAKVDGEELVVAQSADEARRGPLLDALLGGTLDKNATLHAITYATNNHDAASIKRLAAKGVAWAPGESNVTPPLVTAIVASDVPTVRALLDAGAPTRKTSDDGDTALLAAVAAAAGDSEDAVRVVRALLEHGVSPNERGKDGRTALFSAAQQGSETLVALLVAKGARVDDAVDGRTPYEAADAHGYDAITKLLKARGAKVTKAAP